MAPLTIKHKKFWTLCLLGLAILAITFLASGISHMEFLPGEDFPLGALLQALNPRRAFTGGSFMALDILRPLIACMWLSLLVAIIAFIISPEIRRETIRRVIRYLIFALVIYGLVTVLQPFLAKQDLSLPSEAGPVGELGELEALPSPPDFVVNPPDWVVYTVDILLLIIPLTLAWLFWLRWRTPRKGSPLELLTQEAQQALTRLQAGHNLKDTIMRCYAEMSQILQQQPGIQRQQAMTPREFEHYLARSGFKDEHIRQLTHLFEKVRYGAKTPGHQEEQEAVACLQAIIRAYGKAL